MAEINDLTATDASNTDRFPEEMRVNAVNDSARALEGLIARWYKDTNGSVAVAGTDTFTATINADTGFSLYDGFVFMGDFANANTGAATISLTPDGGSALGAKAIKKGGSTALASGDIPAGGKILMVYDGTNFQMLSQIGNDASGDLTTHMADTTTHGVTGAIVGLSDTQTLTNKTLTAPTISGVVGGTATSQTITSLTTTNVDGILGANTPAAVTGTTGTFSGALGIVGAFTGATTGAFSGLVTAATSPSATGHLTNKQYVDDLFVGMGKRGTVKVASTGNLTLSGEQTIDGVTTESSLILVKDQTASELNGVYNTASGAWSRSDLFDTYDEHPGAVIVIQEGTVGADLMYLSVSNTGGTLGSTAINWTKIQPQSSGTVTSIAAGAGFSFSTITSSGTIAVDGVLEDIDSLGAPASDGQLIFATGAGAFAYQSGATARTSLGLGTAAVKNTGTANGDVVLLDATGLPAVDGSQLTGLSGGATDAEKTNIMLNAFRISVNGGLTVKNMVDGVVDEFEDGTGIDASTSTNETLVAGTTTTTPVSSDWTGRGSGNSYASGSVTCTSSGSTYTTLALLKGDFTFQFDFSASSLTSDHTVIGIYATGEDATAGGYQQAGMDIMTNSFYTSPGSPWIKKGSSTVDSSSWANTSDTYQIRRVGTTLSIYNVTDSSTEYTWSGSYTGNYHAAVGGGGGTTVDDIEITGVGVAHITNSGANMDLFSNATTALAVPTDANIIIRQEDGSSAITLNTDLKAYASRNGGTTYTQMTLAEVANLTTGRILTGTVDISGQSSATAMKYKITTHNTKSQKIHAVALQWS